MKQEEYRACISNALKGKKFTKEERKQEFCIASKLCSQKSSSHEEARKLCLEPKPFKPPKQRKTVKQLEKEQEACNPEVFNELISQFNNVYIDVLTLRCAPCQELDNLIHQADLPYQVVQVPDSCLEILNQLEVDAFPTVIHMSKGKIVNRFVESPQDTIEKMRKGL